MGNKEIAAVDLNSFCMLESLFNMNSALLIRQHKLIDAIQSFSYTLPYLIYCIPNCFVQTIADNIIILSGCNFLDEEL